jgi:hypothetical protein
VCVFVCVCVCVFVCAGYLEGSLELLLVDLPVPVCVILDEEVQNIRPGGEGGKRRDKTEARQLACITQFSRHSLVLSRPSQLEL